MSAIEHSTNRQTEERLSIERVLRTLLTIQDSATRSASLREKILSLERKLASNQLHLAVLGQMKRGKSSFINALLGSEILPMGVLPVTAVITEIKYGPAPQAAIIYTTGLRERVDVGTLADYITESGNPGNKKQVASVETSLPFTLSGERNCSYRYPRHRIDACSQYANYGRVHRTGGCGDCSAFSRPSHH